MLAWGGPQIFQNGVGVAPHRPPRPQGLSPGTIREMLPAEPYALPPLGERSPSFTAPECTICLDSLVEGDEVRRLKCGHVFHAECIDSWLVKVAACPLCRVHPITGGLDHPEEQEMVEVHVNVGPEASSAAALADADRPGPSRPAAAGGSSSNGAEHSEEEGEETEGGDLRGGAGGGGGGGGDGDGARDVRGGLGEAAGGVLQRGGGRGEPLGGGLRRGALDVGAAGSRAGGAD